MKARLLKDIVIPAGTIFDTAPSKTERIGDGYIMHGLGLSKDTSGDLVYYIGDEGSTERAQMQDLFEVIKN